MTREEAIDLLDNLIGMISDSRNSDYDTAFKMAIKSLEQESKTGHCKDCKWWKDSDGAYRRGVEAESKCPINRKEVFDGDGYCYMFEPQESEDK